MFKVGDVIECVNSEGSTGQLTLGKKYVVCGTDRHAGPPRKYIMVSVDDFGNSSWFFISRFRRVEKVKTNPCLSATDCMQHYISEQINVVIDTNARKILIDMAKIIGYNVVENEPQPKYSLVKLVKAQ